MDITRRSFFKLVAASSSAAALTGCALSICWRDEDSEIQEKDDIDRVQKPPVYVYENARVIN